MVQYLKNLLSFGPGQRMIQAGDQVQKDHGASKNGHADDIQQVPFLLRPKNQKHRANDSHHCPDPMGNGIEHFFADALAAGGAAGIRHGFCHGPFLLY